MSNLTIRATTLESVTNTNTTFTDFVSLSVTAFGGDITVEAGDGTTFPESMTLKEGLSITLDATNGSVLPSIRVTAGSGITGYVVAMK